MQRRRDLCMSRPRNCRSSFVKEWPAKKLTTSGVAWITTLVHFALMNLFGVATIRAVATHQEWSDWILPVPAEIGLLSAIIAGAACLLTVVNLALKGLGAPFFIALSRKLAADWLYAWTRNPMVLAVLAFLLSLGIWFQSVLFVLWVLILFAPALLAFVKVYEERELEFRFGASYLEYKSRTPMLFPGRPRDSRRPQTSCTRGWRPPKSMKPAQVRSSGASNPSPTTDRRTTIRCVKGGWPRVPRRFGTSAASTHPASHAHPCPPTLPLWFRGSQSAAEGRPAC